MTRTIAVDVDGVTAQIRPRELLLKSFEAGIPVPVTPPVVRSVLENNPLVAGAKEGLAELASRWTVDLVTNRPELLRECTETWADQYDLPVRQVRCVGTETSKGELSDVDVVVDDSLHNVVSAAEHGCAGILFNDVSSQCDLRCDRQDVYVADSWMDVVDIINEVLESPARQMRTPVTAD